ncbi:hypothetical protein [Nocardiopsis synnemataformans]|uniref:hypothetical protein n=1 Tax=Nocardiopsis synnemataformans TaxID=61305 RepID=UPI003EB83AC9
MATGKKRTLDAETHPDPDDNIVDAEVVETFSERVRKVGAQTGERVRQARQHRKQRTSNTPQGQRKAYERKRARGEQQTRNDAAGPNGDQRARLKLQTQLAQKDFLHHLRTSGMTSASESIRTQRKKLSNLHQAYASMMVLQCLQPLQRGVSAENLLRSVGMGTAMWLLSPNFRIQVGDYAGQVATAIGKRLDRSEAKIIARGERSREKEARYFDKTGQGREGMRGLSGMRHRRRLERIERMERGNRDLFTEHSAALTHVGIAQNAYDEMRRPGADRELIKKNFETALSALYGYVDDDGLDRKAVARNMRIIVGQLIERDPEQAAVFSELGHGRFIKTEPQPVFVEGTTQSLTAWTGDYVDVYNGDVITGGAFTLREPMGTDEHRVAVAQTVYGELSSANSPAEFGKVLEQYIIGSITREYPETVELTEDDAARARFDRARAMFSSMRGDGISDQDQKLVYMGGLFESLHAHPRMVAQCLDSLGPEWEQRLRTLIEKYAGFGEHEARERPGEGTWVWVEPEPDSPSESAEADVADADPLNDDARDGERSSSPSSSEHGATPQPAATGPLAALDEAVMYRRGEVCRRVGLVDEHGNVDEKRLAEMELRGVSLGRAARKSGDWFFNESVLTDAEDDQARTVMLIEAISNHMANDVLNTVQASNGRNLTQNMWPIVRVWRNRSATSIPFPPDRAQASVDQEASFRPWGQDEASNARTREMSGMSATMKFLSLANQDRLHSLAYVRALEKIAVTEPTCEKLVHELVAMEGGDPKNWRQHEYEAALKRGYSGEHRRVFQQDCEYFDLNPVTKHTVPGSRATGQHEDTILPMVKFAGGSTVTPEVLAPGTDSMRGSQSVISRQLVQSRPASSALPESTPEQGNDFHPDI